MPECVRKSVGMPECVVNNKNPESFINLQTGLDIFIVFVAGSKREAARLCALFQGEGSPLPWQARSTGHSEGH